MKSKPIIKIYERNNNKNKRRIAIISRRRRRRRKRMERRRIRNRVRQKNSRNRTLYYNNILTLYIIINSCIYNCYYYLSLAIPIRSSNILMILKKEFITDQN